MRIAILPQPGGHAAAALRRFLAPGPDNGLAVPSTSRCGNIQTFPEAHEAGNSCAAALAGERFGGAKPGLEPPPYRFAGTCDAVDRGSVVGTDDAECRLLLGMC